MPRISVTLRGLNSTNTALPQGNCDVDSGCLEWIPPSALWAPFFFVPFPSAHHLAHSYNWLNNLKEDFYTSWGHPGGGNGGEADSSAWYRNHDGVAEAVRTGSASRLLPLHTTLRGRFHSSIFSLTDSQEEDLSTHLGKVLGNDRATPTILECNHLASYPRDYSFSWTYH